MTPPRGLHELLPPLSAHEAAVEANRCLYCYDAPCAHACPTHIYIARFIRKIATENLTGSAQTIFEANLLGATCARVCPVQELCEGACVLGSEHKPVMIGRLQRYAMDYAYAHNVVPKARAATGHKRVAVVGSGPAGLSCAGELALRGHQVTVFEKRAVAGGLSTYGIIALREPVDIALAEARLIERLGVKIVHGQELGGNLAIDQLKGEFDAVFLAVGLGATPSMGVAGEEWMLDGLQYIEHSKMNGGALQVGNNVVVIGAGNTAIDCATVAKRLGAGQVTMLYRRTLAEMSAYPHEYAFVKVEGVDIRFLTQPVRVIGNGGKVVGLECVQMRLDGDAVPNPVPGSEFVVPADQVVKAVGQLKPALAALLGLATDKGYIQVNRNFETSVSGMFAGGDCIRAKNSASTVMAVQDGKLAAEAIHIWLT